VKYQELTGKTVSELYDLLNNLKKELLSFRIQKRVGQLQNTAQIREKRRDAARIHMCLGRLKGGNN